MFSKEKVNIGRQLELDIARGLAVLFMITIHVQIYFANSNVLDSYFADFNDFNGDIPAAPMFMFLLGIGINYTRKNNPALMFRRGVGLFLTAYLLNFVRGFVPYVIRSYSTADITYLYQGFSELMFVDILQFSGLAMMVFALFQKYNFRRLGIALTAIALSALNLVMLNVQTDNFALSSITGLLWGSHENSFFPFLTWMFYPIAGYLFGSLLIRCTNKKKFYAISGLIAAAVFFGGSYLFDIVLEIPTGLTSETGYYHHIFTDNITFTGGVILEISVLSFLAPIIPKFMQSIAVRWSKNVTPIYCIHWVIITWLTLVIPTGCLDMLWFIVLLISIVVISDLSAFFYAKWKTTEVAEKTPVAIPILTITLIIGVIAVTVLPQIWGSGLY